MPQRVGLTEKTPASISPNRRQGRQRVSVGGTVDRDAMTESRDNAYAAALAGLAASAVIGAAVVGGGISWLRGDGSFVGWAAVACPALVPAAALLLSTSLVRKAVRKLDVIGSLVAMCLAGGLSLILLSSFLAFDGGFGAPMQGLGSR